MLFTYIISELFIDKNKLIDNKEYKKMYFITLSSKSDIAFNKTKKLINEGFSQIDTLNQSLEVVLYGFDEQKNLISDTSKLSQLICDQLDRLSLKASFIPKKFLNSNEEKALILMIK